MSTSLDDTSVATEPWTLSAALIGNLNEKVATLLRACAGCSKTMEAGGDDASLAGVVALSPLLLIVNPGEHSLAALQKIRLHCDAMESAFVLIAISHAAADLERWVKARPDDVLSLDDPADFLTLKLEKMLSHQRQTRRLRIVERGVEMARDAIVICDAQAPDCPMVYANAAFEQITGYALAEVYGQNCRFLQSTETNQPGVHTLRHAIRDGHPCQVTLRNYRKDGSLFWNELSISPIRDGSGKVRHYIAVVHDITPRVSAEQQLRTSEGKFRAMADTAPVMLWATDARLQWTYFNRLWSEFSGRPGIRDHGRGWTDLIGETERELFDHKLDTWAREGRPFRFEITVRRADGAPREVIFAGAPVLNEEGLVSGYLGSTVDLSERKTLERVLTRRHRHLAALSLIQRRLMSRPGTKESMHDLLSVILDVCMADRASLIRLSEIEGNEEVSCRSDGAPLGPPILPIRMIPAAFLRQLRAGKSVVSNVSDAAQTEAAWLTNRQAFLIAIKPLLLNDVLTGMLVLESTSPNYTIWSEEDLDLLNAVASAVLPALRDSSQNSSASLEEFISNFPLPALVKSRSGDTVLANDLARRNNGGRKAKVADTAEPLSNWVSAMFGERTIWIGPVQDSISSAQTSPLEKTSGRLIHEGNNLLLAVQAVLELAAQHQSALPVEFAAGTDVLLAVFKRARIWTRQLERLTSARFTPSSSFEINDMLASISADWQALGDKGADVRLQLSHEVGALFGDSDGTELVIASLADLFIRKSDERLLLFASTLVSTETVADLISANGFAAVLVSSDTDRPMLEQLASCTLLPSSDPRIAAEPTLALADQIMRRQRGRALFAFDGPRLIAATLQFSGMAEAAPGAPAAITPSDIKGSILFVEDDTLLLRSIAGCLLGRGFSVLTAASSDQARKVWAENRDRISVVISDVMIDWSCEGSRLVEGFAQERPETRIVLTSGYPREFVASNFGLHDGVEFVPKPFSVSTLLAAVLRLLRQPVPAGNRVSTFHSTN